MNVVFFDGTCPLCHRAIRFILSQDTHKRFLFAPLSGKTAAKHLKKLSVNPSVDTLILLENFETSSQKTFIEGKAVLRILWHLGFPHSFLGLLSFLPPAPFNVLYRLVAKNRHTLFKNSQPLSSQELEPRFLP